MCVCVWCLYPSLKRRSFLFSIRRRESSSFVPLKEEGEIYRGADCCVTGIGKIFLGRKKQTSPLARPTVKIWLRSIHSPELDIGPPLFPPPLSFNIFLFPLCYPRWSKKWCASPSCRLVSIVPHTITIIEKGESTSRRINIVTNL